MKLFILLLLYSNFLLSQVWLQLPDFPGSKRDDGVAVVVNDKAYIGTGLQEWNATIDFHVLDLKNQNWSLIPNMPNTTERQYACAFAGNNSFYVFGGDGGGGALTTMYKYDIATGIWISAASKPGIGLIGAACMSFGDKIIIAGGKSNMGSVSNEVWEYVLSTDTWQQKNTLPFAGRWRASATSHNNTGYLLFGIDTGGAYRKEFYKYDPLNDQWTKIMDFPLAHGRAYASLNVANSKLVVFGGIDTLGNYYKDLWYFNTTSANWSQGPDLPSSGRKGGMSCGYGEALIYSCGIKSGDQRLTETWMTHVPLAVQENKVTSDFSIFPNPVNDWLNIHLSSSLKANSSIQFRIVDILGQEMISLRNLNDTTKINVEFLKRGIYLFSIYSENELMSLQKIIKE